MIPCILCHGVPEGVPYPAASDVYICRCRALWVHRAIDASFTVGDGRPGIRFLSVQLGFDWAGQFGTYLEGRGFDGGSPAPEETVRRVLEELVCEVILMS